MSALSIYYLGDDGKIHMGFDGVPSKLTGPLALIQKIIYTIKTDKGTNLYIPGSGVYLKEVTTIDSNDPLVVQSELSTVVRDVEQQIRASQNDATPANERLLELKLSGFKQDPSDKTQYMLDLFVITEANQNYLVTV
jgi:hypothetical protein